MDFNEKQQILENNQIEVFENNQIEVFEKKKYTGSLLVLETLIIELEQKVSNISETITSMEIRLEDCINMITQIFNKTIEDKVDNDSLENLKSFRRKNEKE